MWTPMGWFLLSFPYNIFINQKSLALRPWPHRDSSRNVEKQHLNFILSVVTSGDFDLDQWTKFRKNVTLLVQTDVTQTYFLRKSPPTYLGK